MLFYPIQYVTITVIIHYSLESAGIYVYNVIGHL